MVELPYMFFEMLDLAKCLHDSELAEKFHKRFDKLELCEESFYELAYEATGWIFEDSRDYYNNEEEFETWVFYDPLIDRFCQLCQVYEQQNDLSEEQNPYRRQIISAINSAFCFNHYSYNFDWRLSASDRGRKRLLFYIGPEFYELCELPPALLEIREQFQNLVGQLEQSVDAEQSEVSEERREAA